MVEFQTQFKKAKIKGEYFEPDTSETEPGQAQDVEQVLDKCLRGIPLKQRKDALMTLALSGVEVGDPNPKTLMEAFESIDLTQSTDFDLADVSAAQQLATAVEMSKLDDGRSSEQLNLKASDERVLKSDSAATAQQKEE